MSHTRIENFLRGSAVLTAINVVSTVATGALKGADKMQLLNSGIITGASAPAVMGILEYFLSPPPHSSLAQTALIAAAEIACNQTVFTIAENLFDVGMSRALFSEYNAIGLSVAAAILLLGSDLLEIKHLITGNSNQPSFLLSLKDKGLSYLSSFKNSLFAPKNENTPDNDLDSTPKPKNM